MGRPKVHALIGGLCMVLAMASLLLSIHSHGHGDTRLPFAVAAAGAAAGVGFALGLRIGAILAVILPPLAWLAFVTISGGEPDPGSKGGPTDDEASMLLVAAGAGLLIFAGMGLGIADPMLRPGPRGAGAAQAGATMMLLGMCSAAVRLITHEPAGYPVVLVVIAAAALACVATLAGIRRAALAALVLGIIALVGYHVVLDRALDQAQDYEARQDLKGGIDVLADAVIATVLLVIGLVRGRSRA